MKIHTKQISAASSSFVDGMKALFAYAKETLGDAWSYEANSDNTDIKLIFTDRFGYTHGWWYHDGSSIDHRLLSRNYYTTPNTDVRLPASTLIKAVVWEATSGSVGIGYQNSDGRYVTVYLLAKFDGTYNGEDLYAVAETTSNSSSAIQNGPIRILGNVNIGSCNHIVDDEAFVGDGVYLHPLYDPISGLVSSDIFGVRSIPDGEYARPGTIVKQGSTSYMAILSDLFNGTSSNNSNYQNLLYVKM